MVCVHSVARSRGGDEPSASPVADSLVMEPVEAVSADGTAIEGYLVRPGRPEALSPRQSRVRDTLKLRGRMPHLEAKPELVVIATSWDQGVKGSLPLAEGLTGAGYTCLVWNPRGKKRRPEILHVRIEGICGRNGSAGRRIPETGGIAARGRRRAGVWGSGAAESRV
ncbi:hypothetical protein RGQ01_09200 [Akkermansia sp. EB-AMDK43]|uniref:hypothetical protein n=1 Tax=Akkermansia sp. EB-AMDK43 TaxID=3073964 RepID=UPI0028686657|nr:hypothetical protein [Akkermansia sp. EB-AMDK43]WMX37197.1 hypothetical protein RGQ01_09200 [Akkermansia sp. EB-AMDK43]